VSQSWRAHIRRLQKPGNRQTAEPQVLAVAAPAASYVQRGTRRIFFFATPKKFHPVLGKQRRQGRRALRCRMVRCVKGVGWRMG